jgi:hypothetical protein
VKPRVEQIADLPPAVTVFLDSAHRCRTAHTTAVKTADSNSDPAHPSRLKNKAITRCSYPSPAVSLRVLLIA